MPADCVLLHSEQSSGQCFTLTDALDGERNLKRKLAPASCRPDLWSVLAEKRLRLRVPEPTASLHDFRGQLLLDRCQRSQLSSEYILDEQFIPRGSVIKNSGAVIAIVAYTGKETKLMQNLGACSFKRSQMEKRVAKTFLINMLCMFLFLIGTVSYNFYMTPRLFQTHQYLTGPTDSASLETETSVAAIMSIYLLYGYLIPLDLAVLLEFTALFYSPFIVWDAHMMHTNRHLGCIDSAKMNSLNLIDNLGEVEFILSDKTGTLTKN